MDTEATRDEPLTTEEARQAVARQMRIERARLELTQEELAAKSGLAISTIRRLEGRERAMTLDQLVAIAGVFRVSPGAFLDAAQASLRQ